MKVRLIATDAATGDHFRMSTTRTPDGVIMTRSKDISNAHEITIDGDKWPAFQEELGLRPCNAETRLRVLFEIEDSDRDATGALADLQAKLAAAESRHKEGVESLGKQLDEANKQTPTGPASGLTEEETTMLQERDDLLVLLMPYVESEVDTPAGVLRKLLEILRAKGYDGSAAVLDETGGAKPDENANGFAPGDAAQAGPNGEPPGPPKVATAPVETKPDLVEFNPGEFKDKLRAKDLAELRGLAAPLGIAGAKQMNAAQIIKALVEAEIARHATNASGPPMNTARPDGEQPVAA